MRCCILCHHKEISFNQSLTQNGSVLALKITKTRTSPFWVRSPKSLSCWTLVSFVPGSLHLLLCWATNTPSHMRATAYTPCSYHPWCIIWQCCELCPLLCKGFLCILFNIDLNSIVPFLFDWLTCAWFLSKVCSNPTLTPPRGIPRLLLAVFRIRILKS